MKKNIAVISGDGIGPEIMTQALKVLDKIAKKFGHHFIYNEVLAGGCAIDATGFCLPETSLMSCKQSDSVLLAAVGGPKWDKEPSLNRPEKALLTLRSELGLFANIRPAKLFTQLREASPLKENILDKGIDFVIVRELIGGVYFGEHQTQVINGEKIASDLMSYSQSQIVQIARVAFDLARLRKKKLVSVDKANVLDSSRLWREVVEEIHKDYADIELTHMYVDNAAMQICREPSYFDVILTENMFGDILSDEASMITGTIGTIASSSLNNSKLGLYEPIHGSAPDIAGKDLANPIAMILSAAMMLRHSFDMVKESESVEKAVNKALDANYRTMDMKSEGMNIVGCEEMGNIICDFI